ncbi:MAG: VWA domain-containing protein [Oscillospiraceae bacterium]|jgi:Ca-activated chloride channel family protein|nr:VWA domain-containing protein [Oscillospiraceae bacterium]
MKKTRILARALCAALLVSLFTGCGDTDVTAKKNRYTYGQAVTNLKKLYDRVRDKSTDNPAVYDTNGGDFWYPDDDTSALLPDFFTGRQAVVNENRADAVMAIVLSSTEKAVANDTDRWLIDVAEAYNKKGDRLGSIRLYGQPSGESFDYIRSGKFVPDAWTPSNHLWGDALGYVPDYDRIAGNVAGIVSKDGLSIADVVSRVEEGSINFGYTNPLASSTGANFLLQYIHNLRSAEQFAAFQRNIALVSYTTPQMRAAALSGSLDAFVYESQQFATGVVQGSRTTLADMYKFEPFGVRHDNPVYILNEQKRELLEDFFDYCLTAEMQRLADGYGFNQFNNYAGASISGATMREDQAHYRENKSGGRPVVSVFVCDVSGSMDGTPLQELKQSLRSCAGVISQGNHIGLVTFASDVKVNLPIAPYDDTMRSRFIEATGQMVTRGNTSIFSALVVASQMIVDYKAANPGMDAIYRVFLLTDGENTSGLTKSITLDTLQSLSVPIYCIGYNNGSSDLDDIAGLNEAAHVRMNDQNVGYALANFFRAEF